MRLIDADKLEVKHFVQRTEKIIGYDGTQPRYELKDVLAYAIDDAPTIKAIPVEWIEEWQKRHEWKYQSYFTMRDGKPKHAIECMIEDWRKANEESLVE